MNNVQNYFNSVINFFSPLPSKVKDLYIQKFRNGVPFVLPLPASFQWNHEYWRFTRHLKKEELALLEQKIQDFAPHQPTKETSLLRALEKRDWQDPIFQEDYLIYALAALREGRLTKNQVATLSLYWAAATYNTPNKTGQEISSFSLFTSEGEPNREAWDLIKQSQVRDMSLPEEESPPLLTEEQLQTLFDRMKKAPSSEQQVLVYELGDQGNSEIIRLFLEKLGFNLLTEVTKPDEEGGIMKLRMIPSVTLMQEVLYTLYGEQAVEIDSILRICRLTPHIANNAVEDQRTMSFHFPHLKLLPEKADSFVAPGIDFSIHDLYHAFIVSGMPAAHRYAFARAASILEHQGEKTPAYKAFIVRLKDMEVVTYRKNQLLEELLKKHGFSTSEKFWQEILIHDAFTMKDSQYNFVPILIDYFQHQEEWKREFNIEVQPETKNRLAGLMDSPDQRKKMIKIWKLVELAWDTQQLIQAGNEEEAQEKIKQAFPPKPKSNGSYSWGVSGDSIKDPDYAWFFATFNDREAFKIMIKLLPQTVLPLHLSHCHILDDALLAEIVNHVNQLRKTVRCLMGDDEIHLNGCRHLTDQSIKLLAESGYVKFDLSGCESLVNGLSFLPKETKELTLDNLKSLKDEHVKNLKHCSELSSLYLSGNLSLTDACLESLSDLSRLGVLKLSGCHQLTSQAIEEFVRLKSTRLKQLYTLAVLGCKQLNEEALDAISNEALLKGVFIEYK